MTHEPEYNTESANEVADQMMAEEEFLFTNVKIDIGCNNLQAVQDYVQKYGITKEKRDALLQTVKCHAWMKKNEDYSRIRNFLNNINL